MFEEETALEYMAPCAQDVRERQGRRRWRNFTDVLSSDALHGKDWGGKETPIHCFLLRSTVQARTR